MGEVEKRALKDVAHLCVDKELDPVLKDFIAKLPAAYAPIVAMLEASLLPAIIAAVDAKIDAL